MAVRLTWSYAPMPSTDGMVRVGPASVASCRLWTPVELQDVMQDVCKEMENLPSLEQSIYSSKKNRFH